MRRASLPETTTQKLTIPAHLCEITPEEKRHLDDLLRRFGGARRHAYRLRQKQTPTPQIESTLQQRFSLNGRYAKDAHHSILSLPRSHVTFGGLRNQRLREKGRITRAEYRARRDALLISRGEKVKGGNLNLRVNLESMQLRISTGKPRQWITPRLYIPKKYLERYSHLLDGSQAYQVVVRHRDNDRGYDVKITVTLPSVVVVEGSRLLTLDVNAGHTGFAVLDKGTLRVLAMGSFYHQETQYVRCEHRDTLLHRLVDKIGNMATHFDADVVVGKLNTGRFNSPNRRATRKVRQMPQYKFRQLLKWKLTGRGVRVLERSEAYTSKIGSKLGLLWGLDVHKCAAVVFAIKVIDYALFRGLMKCLLGVPTDEGCGSPRKEEQGGGRGLTALCPCGPTRMGVRRWRTMKQLCNISCGAYPATPGSRGPPASAVGLEPDLALEPLLVKIC